MEGGYTLVTAAQPLADNGLSPVGLSPVQLGPKEGLALVYGTVISAGAAALAMHEAHHLAVLHGGNFQARSLTSATEKTRSAIQTIGRMLFTQCTEIINPATSQGLPPNLVSEEPSSSFAMKAVDLMVAALQFGLGFLANRVDSHVQTAEMGNQALSSLALISARYTHTAVDVLSQLAAAQLLALCQALDLRLMMWRFLGEVSPGFMEETMALLKAMGVMDVMCQDQHLSDLWILFLARLEETVRMDAQPRFNSIAKSLIPYLIDLAHFPLPSAFDSPRQSLSSELFLEHIVSYNESLAAHCLNAHHLTRETYFSHHDATPFLGSASKRMYGYIRYTLKRKRKRASQGGEGRARRWVIT
ncbi:MAG: hypothetical protein Q9212_001477 [Teloschistes hypoglaucus]